MMYRIVLLILALAGFAPAQPTPTAPLASGNDAAIWLVRPNGANKSFNIYARRFGQSWQAVLTDLQGRPDHIQAVGESIHLFYDKGQHLLIDLSGRDQMAENVPGKLLATCQAPGYGGNNATALLAIVSRDTPPPPPSTTAQSTSAPAAIEVDGQYVGLWSCLAGQWTYRAPLRAEMLGASVRLAYIDRQVLLCSSQDGQLTLWKSTGGQGFKPIARPAKVQADILGMTPLTDWLVFVQPHRPTTSPPATTQPATAPGDSLLRLELVGLHDEQPPAGPQTIQQDGQAITWPEDTRPAITRLRNQLALVWTHNQSSHLLLCNPDGTVTAQENITERLTTLPDEEQVLRVQQYFTWGVLVVVILTMVLLRPRTAPKPFNLPDQVTTPTLLTLVKRLVAALVDFVPWTILCVLLIAPGLDYEAEARKMMADRASIPPIRLLIATMAALVLYVLYCIVTEKLWGATVGKRLLKLRVVADEGNAPALREAALRNLLKLVELPLLSSPFLLGLLVLVPAITRYRQRLGDLVARTTVVESRQQPLPRRKEEPADSTQPPHEAGSGHGETPADDLPHPPPKD